jgi:hypothetical protein
MKFMKRFTSKIAIALSATITLLFMSCQVKDDGPEAVNYSAENSQKAAQTDNVVEGTFNIMENGYEENAGPTPFNGVSFFPNCTTITLTTNGNSGTIVLDFGTACELNNGAVVSGKINMAFGPIIGGTRTIDYTFENFTYNSNGVTGGGTILREIANDNGNPQSTVNESITVSFPNTDVTATRNGLRIAEWTEGVGSGTWVDNVYEISGNWETTFTNGFSRSGEVTQVLVRKLSCLYIVSGRLVVEQQSLTGEFNWGDGTCDNLATFTFNGETYPIILGN